MFSGKVLFTLLILTVDVCASPPSSLSELQNVGWQHEIMATSFFQCPAGQVISAMMSSHSDWHDDRQWKYACRPSADVTNDCEWSGWANELNRDFSFQCRNNGIIAGVHSEHHDWWDDRLYKFYCCRASKPLLNCYVTNYLNEVMSDLAFGTEGGRYLAGMSSTMYDWHDDRRFKATVCGV